MLSQVGYFKVNVERLDSFLPSLPPSVIGAVLGKESAPAWVEGLIIKVGHTKEQTGGGFSAGPQTVPSCELGWQLRPAPRLLSDPRGAQLCWVLCAPCSGLLSTPLTAQGVHRAVCSCSHPCGLCSWGILWWESPLACWLQLRAPSPLPWTLQCPPRAGSKARSSPSPGGIEEAAGRLSLNSVLYFWRFLSTAESSS